MLTAIHEATVPVTALPVLVPSALSTPVPAGLQKAVVAANPAIFVGNRVLWENHTRCQDYERTGHSMHPHFLCPFTHGNVPSNDVRSVFFKIEQFYDEANGASSFRSKFAP
jgi:hypothetical protein